jgi:undecaprenyl-diphosphatase
VGLLQVIATAAVQAVTAFLPVGSSGHRLLVSRLTGWPPPDLAMSLAVDVGMILAVAGYFWRDMIALAIGVGQVVRGPRKAEARLLLFLLGAAIPAGIVAVALADMKLPLSPSLAALGWLSIAFGLLLYVADRIGVTVRRLPHMTWGAALLIGAAQVAALVPGVGRCGIAVTAARLLGFERHEAARFALLLALPVLIGSGILSAFDLASAGGGSLTAEAAVAGVTAFALGLAAIALMMNWLRSRTFAPFALYRVIAGGALLGWMVWA